MPLFARLRARHGRRDSAAPRQSNWLYVDATRQKNRRCPSNVGCRGMGYGDGGGRGRAAAVTGSAGGGERPGTDVFFSRRASRSRTLWAYALCTSSPPPSKPGNQTNKERHGSTRAFHTSTRGHGQRSVLPPVTCSASVQSPPTAEVTSGISRRFVATLAAHVVALFDNLCRHS